MQYEFIDINQSNENNERLTTFVGDHNLDELGFRTLTVTGRGLIAPELSIVNRPHNDGTWIDSANYRGREIKVIGIVDTERYDDLTLALYKGLTSLEFSDDPDWVWYVHLMSVSEPIENNRQLKVTLTFYSSQPYKYSSSLNMTEISFDEMVTEAIKYPTVPDTIMFRPDSSIQQVRLTNLVTGKVIRLNGDFQSGQSVQLWFNPYRTAVGGVPNLASLDLMSDLSGFTVRWGDVFDSNVRGSILVRAKSL